jgi:hypothetical protein
MGTIARGGDRGAAGRLRREEEENATMRAFPEVYETFTGGAKRLDYRLRCDLLPGIRAHPVSWDASIYLSATAQADASI